MRRLRFCCALVCLPLAGCAVGPNYHRPKVSVPGVYRPQPPSASPQPTTVSLGSEKWWEVFQDPVLQQLIRTALQRNYDVRVAAARILEAQAEVGITRSNQFPTAAAGAQGYSERNPKISGAFGSYQTNVAEVDLSVIWNLDFWGKYRRQTESARDNLLASEWGHEAVISSVVSSVAADYFQLRELDLALEMSRRTLASRQDSLRLTRVLAVNGSASLLELRQAEELVYTAAEQVPDLERQIQQEENAISDLLGENPQPIARGLKLTEEPLPAAIPAGLPSELLERRPDIREAEANLMAANANIGVAKAALFPSISLTGTAGFESYSLSKLFTGSAGLWNTGASLTQPVFEAGALRSGMRLVRAQEEQLLLTYKQTIIGAFQQVSDGLIAYQKDREFREQQERLTSAAADADRLSKILYQNGGASYLQVLTSETNYFAAELNLAQAQLNERLALVQLYNALGGGWQQ
ncbi:MAG TPA: efflux transporter outer membrane subunit [Terriglobales bacterium]|nr:efflux transporter outer membrane subunit [Terriglobales bacterium]